MSTGISLALTIAEAAAEMGVSYDAVRRWVEGGHLPFFVPPGHDLADARPGPKGYRIFRSDWEAFKQRQTYVGGSPIAPVIAPVAAGPSTGIERKRCRR